MKRKLWLAFLFLWLAFLSGCFNKSMEYLLKQKLGKTATTHQEILTENTLERTMTHGTLSERTLFLGLFPLYLAQMGNFIEQTTDTQPVGQKRISKDVFEEENEPLVENMLAEKNVEERAIALEMLDSQTNHKKTMEIYLEDKDPYVKLVALHNLQNNQQRIEYTTSLLQEKNEAVRIEVIHSIQMYKDKNLLYFLYLCLKDSSPIVRAKAANALGTMGFLESIEYLWDLLDDKEQYVRKEAGEALQQLTGKDVSYSYHEMPEKRKAAILAWRLWWKEKSQMEKGKSNPTKE